MKKTAVVFLAALLACSSVGSIGCAGREKGEAIDKTKTQLYVTTFEGGYGIEWLKKVKTRFEADYANETFGTDKTGVQVMISEDRELTHETLVNNLDGMDEEVFFTEWVNYYDLQSRDLLYDITDAVTGTIAGEGVSVESKMRDVHKNYFKTTDGKYYGIPFYEANYGIVYDVDLFESEGLYFAAEGDGNAFGFVKDKDGNGTFDSALSNGPDGKSGTADDGLPATYDQFFELCDYMAMQSITPITWGGKTPHYVNALIEALQTDYEGKDQMMLNYTANGLATNLVESIDENGNVTTYSEEITADNGYLTWSKQAGKYYALKFVERLIENDTYYNVDKVTSTANDHLTAQDDFISGKFIKNAQPVGMLIDGSWWNNEASDTFKALESDKGAIAGAKNRKFGFMPIPKATADKVGEEYTILETNNSICFVNGNLDPKKEQLVKTFIQYCHTNASLAEFTSTTYTCKPYAYTMTNTEVNAMPYWGQELYRLHNSATFVPTYSNSLIYKANARAFTEYFNSTMFSSTVGKTTHKVVPTAMIEDGVSALEYFNGLSTYFTESRWASSFVPKTNG